MLKLKRQLSLLCLSSVVLILSACACVTISDTTTCTASGLVINGGLCSHQIAPWTFKLSPTELIDMLNAQPADRQCCPVPGFPFVCADVQTDCTPITVAARGAAVIMVPNDWGSMKTNEEVLCRDAGSGCTLGTPIPDPSASPSASPSPTAFEDALKEPKLD